MFRSAIQSSSVIAFVMSALMAFALFCGFSKPADAGEFVIFGNASFDYFNDAVVTNEYRGDIKYYGGHVGIHPEYRFVKWFGLGVDVGFGGLKSEPYKNYVYNTAIEYDSSYTSYTIDALLTFKFIAPLSAADLWAELGLGAKFLGNYLNDERKIVDMDAIILGRLRLGVTFNLNESLGLGVHGGASLLPMTIGASSAFTADGGVHFLARF